MLPTRFKVTHDGHACGFAFMTARRVTFHADPKAYAWLEARHDVWLRDFASVVKRLCRSVGHAGKFSISQDIDSGIVVERIS